MPISTEKGLLRYFLNQIVLNQLVALAIATFLFLYSDAGSFFPIIVTSLIFSNCIGFGVEVFYTWIFRLDNDRYLHLSFRTMWKHVAVVYLGMLVGNEIALLICTKMLHFFYYKYFSWLHLFFLLFNFVAAVVVVLLVAGFRVLKYNLQVKIRENRELQELQVRTQLAVLRAKINPHFLFNTLNAILDLVHRSPDRVETMVINLSHIYRRVLSSAEMEWQSLGEELELIRRYLEIEKIRMEERLEYEICAAPEFMACRFPPLLLEPLVENAVIHGIAPKIGGGRITVRVEPGGSGLLLTVRDDGVGVGEGGYTGGFGIHSVRERMKLIYRERGDLRITAAAGGGTCVTMEVPREY